ncbi:MAG TPA: Uma2 family endonuclease [Pyrinomonadaceae bacterium]|jgi:Uma2 family endonuclease|nr:Uma2 family endonuclease [Pyrinomonadaceae bacterium]
MASLPSHYFSPEEYLSLERRAEFKSEYFDGVIYAMAGGSERHNLITGNLVTELNIRLRERPCRVYPSDMKVRMPNSKRFFYPDVSVVCGEPQFADEVKDVLLNPILIVEVLSESTEAFDRGKKFSSYQQIESLREYLLVAQDEFVVEHYLRQEDGWLYTKANGLDTSLVLPALDCQIALSDIYNKVS